MSEVTFHPGDKELLKAEAELDAFEAELWHRIGLDPDDGPIDAYLNQAHFETAAKLDRLRDRVSLLLAGAA